MAGSIVDVAQAVGEEIAQRGMRVDILPISEIEDLQAYDGVVVGGPMIMG
jgi:menaquinone-dependent protoporphyrinogen IX oxidase